MDFLFKKKQACVCRVTHNWSGDSVKRFLMEPWACPSHKAIHAQNDCQPMAKVLFISECCLLTQKGPLWMEQQPVND